MKVDVQLLGPLSRFSPTENEKFQLDVEAGGTVGQLLEKMKLPEDVEKVVLVNGVRSNLSSQLAEGDDVFIFTPAAGG